MHGLLRFLLLTLFPHITSSLSWAAKYNIMLAGFHCLTRQVTKHADIWDHLGRIGCDIKFLFVCFLCRACQVTCIMRSVRSLFYRHGAVLGPIRGQYMITANKQTKNLRCGNRKGLLGRNDQTHHRMGPKTMESIPPSKRNTQADIQLRTRQTNHQQETDGCIQIKHNPEHQPSRMSSKSTCNLP